MLEKLNEALIELRKAGNFIVELMDYPEENGERSEYVRTTASKAWDHYANTVLMIREMITKCKIDNGG